MARKPKNDYEVGYGKPPQGTQFRKGQSGNSNGRPKATTSFAESAERELRTKMTVREGGRETRISKRDLVVKQLASQAVKGDKAAAKLLFLLDEKAHQPANVDDSAVKRQTEVEPTDLDILTWFTDQVAKDRVPPSETGGAQ